MAQASAKQSCDKAVAFQIKDEADLIHGPVADGRVGDFKLCNSKISVVVEGARNSNGYHPYGGMVVDLIRTGQDGADVYNKVFPIVTSGANVFTLRTVKATSVRVEQGQGQAKIIVEAEDASFPVIESYIAREIAPHNFNFTIEYILKDGESELVTRMEPRTNRKYPWTVGVGMGFFAGDGLKLTAPEFGYNTGSMVRKKIAWLEATADHISYAWVVPKLSFSPIFPYNTSLFGQYQGLNVPPEGGKVFVMHTLVSGGDTESLHARAQSIRYGEAAPAQTRLSVNIQQPANNAGSCDRVSLYALKQTGSTRSYFSMTTVKKDCTATFDLPKAAYHLVAGEEAVGAWGDTDVSLEDGQPKSVTLARPATATMEVQAAEPGKKGLLPNVYTLFPQFPLQNLPAEVGLDTGKGGYADIVPLGYSSHPVVYRAGTYSLRTTHGFEYTVYSQSVTLAPGEHKVQKLTLTRQVSRPGWQTVDPHLHFLPSMDSDHSMEDGMLAVVGHGLDIAVTTDHNIVTDPKPTIMKVGVKDHLKGVVGIELTTYSTGHFNLFPLKYGPNVLNHGFDVPDWHKLKVPQLWDRMRALHGKDILVQVNHGLGGKGGFFSAAGYDPETGVAKDKTLFPDNLHFDLMEILNNPMRDRMWLLLRNWISFMQRNRRVVMTGVSDTHDFKSLDTGLCRTYVKTGKDDVLKVSDADFVAAMRKGRATVSCGQFMDMVALKGAKILGGLGDTVSAKDKKASLRINVKAAEWIGAEQITVYVNDMTPVKTINIPQKPGPINFTTTVDLSLAKDSFVWAMVTSSKPLTPFYLMGEPTAIVNPIFFDVNGDGKWVQ